MTKATCKDFRTAISAFFADQLDVSSASGLCIASLPIKTADGRFVDVFLEEKLSGFVTVHDGGKAVAELYAQGIHRAITDQRRTHFQALAKRFGVAFNDRGVFETACKLPSVPEKVLAIAQCASLAMFDVAAHEPDFKDKPIVTIVRRSLEAWKPAYIDLLHRVDVIGQLGASHRFDSVAHSKDRKHKTVAVKTLAFGHGGPIQADRYGFMVLDLKGTDYFPWRRLAVIARANHWTLPALKLVRKLSADTLELRTGEESLIEKELPKRIQKLVGGRRTAA